jgi:hypothetical protein
VFSITSYDDYCAIYSKRHDLIHGAICDKLGITFGEKTVDSILQPNKIFLNTTEYYNEVKSLTPDFMRVVTDTVEILEVTVSVDLHARNRKAAKYALLCTVLKNAGFKVDYKIYVFNPRNVYINKDELILQGLDDLVIDYAALVCKRSRELLFEVHKTAVGSVYYQTFFDLTDLSIDTGITIDDVFSTHHNMSNKCFHSESDLSNIFKAPTSGFIEHSDKQFLLDIKDKAKSITSKLISKEDFNYDKFRDYMKNKSNTSEKRSILPICYVSPKLIDSSIRSTMGDYDLVQMMLAKMSRCNSSVLSSIGHYGLIHFNSLLNKDQIINENFLFKVNFSEQDKYDIALEGPGRKKYLKKNSTDHIEATRKHDAYALDLDVDVSDVERISFRLSQRTILPETGSMESDMENVSTLEGFGLHYVKLCQTIYREININSMRGDRRHKFIIKPTGAVGVYICLYPGTKLRCGELPNVVWFKILIDNDFANTGDPIYDDWVFKKLYWDGQISHSRWLSCDVHRLDHYIRCYDKILMTYTAFIAQRYKSSEELLKTFQHKRAEEEMFNLNPEEDKANPIDHSLIRYINNDQTNVLGLIILTYMEDKRSTSKMLQNIRYLVMTSISIFPQYDSVMDKFKEAIRTPLQLFFLRKCFEYIAKMNQWKPKNHTFFGQVKYDYKTHSFLDMFGGSTILLPRPIVSGGSSFVDFSEILSEMYFTMLFNKNQDDPTHSSFQILDKIIEGEDNFQKIKSQGNHLGYRSDLSDLEFAALIVDNPELHQFSKKSIEIGSKLQRQAVEDPAGDHYKVSINRRNVNKTLDQYATFKSSAGPIKYHYNQASDRQSTRVRCLQGVQNLIKEGLMTTLDVVKKYKNEQTYYHVFKKNQIGGVREILILPITNRIRINLLETISRNLCSFDKREILTHGVTKYDSIKSVLYTSKKYEGIRSPIHLTFDKSKWGPGFVPIQFVYLFTQFKHQLGSYFPYIIDVLIRHQNKDCVLPDRLMDSWFRDDSNKYKHEFPGLQHLKEKFLIDKTMTYKNESNMGQGILHYTSSFLHLCMISFRNEIYKLWCLDDGLNYEDHEDLLSSDDSYTIFCPELYGSDVKFTMTKLKMFLQCQQISEYLFNCRTSLVKSSINPLVGEFNSLFVSNMTFIPTLMKYCLSSVHPTNTDSFFRMVKESYGASRQIIENGGGLDLYYLSSILNKNYCESIYHTQPGGVNNLSNLGITHIPYHIGYFPLFNPSLMVMFGPEYYNYKLYKKSWGIMNKLERKLFMSAHKVIKGDLLAMLSEFEDGDTMLGGLNRIEAAIGPVKQLETIRRSSALTAEELTEMVEKDPLLIIRSPKTIEEVQFRVTHKLYTTGSKEGLKFLAASIFYGRVSATVSANVFYMPGDYDKEGKIIKRKYRDCMEHLLEIESEYDNLDSQIKFIYPKHIDYDIFLNNDEFKLSFRVRNPFEIQTVQKLVTHKIYTKLTQPVSDILSYYWGIKTVPEHLSSKVDRDIILMNSHFPLIKSTIEETKKQFKASPKDQVKTVLLLILKMFSLKDRSFKGVIFGMGSHDISRTYETLLERNFSNSHSGEMMIQGEFTRSLSMSDKIYCLHNHSILSKFSESKEDAPNIWSTISDRELTIFFHDPSINVNIKKRIFMVAVSQGFIVNADTWSGKVGLILHYWIKKQKYQNGRYFGDFILILVMGKQKLSCSFNQRSQTYSFSKTGITDPITLYDFITEFRHILDIDESIISRNSGLGPWMIVDNKILKTNGDGFRIDEVSFIEDITFSFAELRCDFDWTRLVDESGYRMYNIETGLLSTNYIIDEKYDFRVFGLSFREMCKIGSFNQNFNVQYKSRDDILNSLVDLEVDRPEVTDITKKKFLLPDDWSLRVEENFDEDIILEDQTDPMLALMNFTPTIDMLPNPEESNLQEYLNFLGGTDAIFSMKTTQRIHNARKLFCLVRNLKYDMITRLVLVDNRINKLAIISAGNIITNGNKKFILYSLLSFHDRVYRVSGQKTPDGVFLDIYGPMISKFSLKMRDEEVNFD